MSCELTGLQYIRCFMSFFLKIEIHSVMLVSIRFPGVGEDFSLEKGHLARVNPPHQYVCFCIFLISPHLYLCISLNSCIVDPVLHSVLPFHSHTHCLSDDSIGEKHYFNFHPCSSFVALLHHPSGSLLAQCTTVLPMTRQWFG